ncbi:glycosyltransferase [Salinigranum marinum]|uniref:glycosyltransferase family 4 protein n=1 Tax=Salinigranum marinum TaxID=1515595 RepID=UPI002989EE1E|nr:glycosyltransferase [Salinigranum marinum]
MIRPDEVAASPSTGELRVLVYTPGIRGYFVQDSAEYVGGREQQYSLLVPRLQQRPGLDVHAIVYDVPETKTDVTYHEIRHPSARPVSHLSFLRDVQRIWQAVDPDIVLQSGAQASTYVLGGFCAFYGTPFVFHWASDADQHGRKVPPSYLGPRLYRLSRAAATLNIVQTTKQREVVNGRSELIPNILDERREWKQASGNDVLWLGSIRDKKHPERFVQLASELPSREFKMAGGFRGSDQFETRLSRLIAETPNLTHVGSVPREEVPEYLATGRCLVNTSDVEGFSNTFLEAAAAGLPIVSFSHDPNDLIEQHDAGIVVEKTSLSLAEAVERVFDETAWERYRKGCGEIAQRHEADAIVDSFHTVLLETANRGRGGPNTE